MALVRAIFFKAAKSNFHVMVTHIRDPKVSSDRTRSSETTSQHPRVHQLHPQACAVGNLEQLARHYAYHSLAESTRRAYATGQTRYTNFCYSHGIPSLPVTQYSTTLFVTYLASSGLSYNTIKLYLTATMELLIETDHKDLSNWTNLHRTLQGIKRQHSAPVRNRLPVTISILRTLKNALRHSQSLLPVDQLMMWSAFTIAFFGFLRVSEFTAQSPTNFNEATTMVCSDIHFDQSLNSLNITIKSSKTNPFRRGQNIIVAASGSSVPCELTYVTPPLLCTQHNLQPFNSRMGHF
ncbi:uncharacterized protein LOC102807268 [Saccoglossus kowalevskii]|uniref:Uncharacterized protein LOC102807268 n=1 Tax=Saccoglossus kowalevskii TaxID=10224 RepID=A0ABM0MC99_SACKO|nr:PREDICTED: uncharacterized protein LOC102807268 [Saccoglossus kowalevskii]